MRRFVGDVSQLFPIQLVGLAAFSRFDRIVPGGAKSLAHFSRWMVE